MSRSYYEMKLRTKFKGMYGDPITAGELLDWMEKLFAEVYRFGNIVLVKVPYARVYSAYVLPEGMSFSFSNQDRDYDTVAKIHVQVSNSKAVEVMRLSDHIGLSWIHQGDWIDDIRKEFSRQIARYRDMKEYSINTYTQTLATMSSEMRAVLDGYAPQ